MPEDPRCPMKHPSFSPLLVILFAIAPPTIYGCAGRTPSRSGAEPIGERCAYHVEAGIVNAPVHSVSVDCEDQSTQGAWYGHIFCPDPLVPSSEGGLPGFRCPSEWRVARHRLDAAGNIQSVKETFPGDHFRIQAAPANPQKEVLLTSRPGDAPSKPASSGPAKGTGSAPGSVRPPDLTPATSF